MNINDVFARVCGIVEQHGWAVQSVFADAERGIPEFSYTIGMAKRGLPEIMIFAVEPRMAQFMLNDAAQKLVDGELKPEEGALVPELANVPLRVKTLSETQFEAFGNMARLHGEISGVPVTSILLQFPDQAGLFPGEPGCDPLMIKLQDVDSLAFIKASEPTPSPRGRSPRRH